MSTDQENRRGGLQTRLVRGEKIRGPMKVLLLTLAGLLGLLDHALHGFGTTAFAAGFAFLAPFLGYRKYWNAGQFWITAILLAGVQVAAVILLHTYVDAWKLAGALLFGAADCFLITLAFAWVCSPER